MNREELESRIRASIAQNSGGVKFIQLLTDIGVVPQSVDEIIQIIEGMPELKILYYTWNFSNHDTQVFGREKLFVYIS